MNERLRSQNTLCIPRHLYCICISSECLINPVNISFEWNLNETSLFHSSDKATGCQVIITTSLNFIVNKIKSSTIFIFLKLYSIQYISNRILQAFLSRNKILEANNIFQDLFIGLINMLQPQDILQHHQRFLFPFRNFEPNQKSVELIVEHLLKGF